MGMYTIRNQELVIKVHSFGAELKSLKARSTGREYLWQADPAYWKRTSPVLFPLVGNYINKEMHYRGKSYTMSQHGFARDREFTCIRQEEKEIWFRLEADEETKKSYPFAFVLEIGYELTESRTVKVTWKVTNQDDKEMYFSIGGHPAFYCPLNPGEKQTDYSIYLEGAKEITSRRIGEGGLATDTLVTYPLEESCLPIDAHLFDYDALVVENHQTQKVSLLDPGKHPYVTVSFDAPLFGLWSPPKKNAPFVCIEPWHGRCDHEKFEGALEEREWGNRLSPGEVFEAFYTISI